LIKEKERIKEPISKWMNEFKEKHGYEPPNQERKEIQHLFDPYLAIKEQIKNQEIKVKELKNHAHLNESSSLLLKDSNRSRSMSPKTKFKGIVSNANVCITPLSNGSQNHFEEIIEALIDGKPVADACSTLKSELIKTFKEKTFL
jgi:hypothetical protein